MNFHVILKSFCEKWFFLESRHSTFFVFFVIVNVFYCSVDIMSKKLDPEGLGIILLNAFMDEFFPEEKRSTPDEFDLIHYNGIPRSNVEDKVRLPNAQEIYLLNHFIQFFR